MSNVWLLSVPATGAIHLQVILAWPDHSRFGSLDPSWLPLLFIAQLRHTGIRTRVFALNAAILAVDLQVDFFVAHPRLIRNRPTLASNVNALLAEARRSQTQVFWIKQVFAPDLHDAPREVRRSGHRITIAGTAGVELLPELVVAPSDYVIDKRRYSAFFETPLNSILLSQNCQRIIVAGINTHACVRTTAIDAYQRDFDVVLARDCIDSHDEHHHDVTMQYLDGRIGTAMSNEQLRNLLRSH
jgi:nicotinamidase-related amidase